MADTYLSLLQEALHSVMKKDSRCIILGEDLADPYGGAFKVSQGLSTQFPERIFNTPISESAIIGLCTGLAVRGFLPVAEIMFGDFLALATDQILNSATKFGLMYRDNVHVPMVIRTPMGGGRGYGPTHSQSIEKMFMGIPGLKVISPAIMHPVGEILKHCIINEKQPVLFIENKQLYPKKISYSNESIQIEYLRNETGLPIAVLNNSVGSDPDVVILGYGGVSQNIITVMLKMLNEEINVVSVIPSWINEVSWVNEIDGYRGNCKLFIIVEMGTKGFNWGSEISAKLYEIYQNRSPVTIKRLSSKNEVIPAARDLEDDVLLNPEKIYDAILENLL